MQRIRVIPTLLVRNGGLVKTVKFKNPRYVGDPLNAVKIFNDKEVDEIVILDISATLNNKPPDFRFIAELAGECFMPLTYGGGITSVEEIKKIFHLGVEKVAINSAAIQDRNMISEAASMFGNQSIVVSIDAKKQPDGTHHVMKNFGTEDTGIDVVDWAKKVEEAGAGELFLTSVDQDGSYKGYDIYLVSSVANAVEIPVIASGGVGEWEHLVEGIKKGGASAVSVGNKFHFTEHSTMHAKKYMRERGIDLR